ncbi:MAG: DUF1232 domain-containing protein [Solobacterium sp.]|nr:DUF1232 domain-containing protein [Solobacterium sp.]MBR2830387.1 DUF1232 domain-containing protein [Solobacterium sp.]MBR3128002.1 DUF1232 domain-containing protein [Solobacterium sp.]
MEQIVSIDKAKEVIDGGIDQAQEIIKNNAELNELITKVQTTVKNTPVLGDAVADLPVMVSMVRSYATKEYTVVSPKVIAALVSTFLYLVKRKDLIPDSIPILGHLDDIAIAAVALKLSEPELKAYREWAEAKEAAPKAE